MSIPSKYSQPSKKDLAIIIPYFNPCNSKNIKNNLLVIKNIFDNSNIPYFIGEIVFKGYQSIFKPQDNIFSFESDSYMFYKENIINIVEEKIPECYTKICFIDGDIFYTNNEWYSIVSNTLDKFTICQPFSNGTYLDKTNSSTMRNVISCVKTNIDTHPGFAWAFQRKYFKQNKLFELAIIGGGDKMLESLLFEDRPHTKKTYLNQSFEKYKKNFNRKFSLTYCDLEVFHLYHGDINKRQYKTRNNIISDLLITFSKQDVSELLEKDENKILQWKKEYKDRINKQLLRYFSNRYDDK